MKRRRFVLSGSVLLSVPFIGCGGDDDPATGGTGGQGTGGSGDGGSTSGGTTSAGGSTTTGGTSSGGTTSSGGDAGSGGSGGGTVDDVCVEDIAGTSSFDVGHDHAFVLPLSAILAGEKFDLIVGAEDEQHQHVLVLTADDLATLRDGGTVEKPSGPPLEGGGSHTHDVQISCSPDD